MHFKTNLIWAIAIIVMAWTIKPASAETFHVPGDYPTIQVAINATADYRDEIVIAPGTYNESLLLISKSITIRSSHGPEVTAIDADGLGLPVAVILLGSTDGPNFDGLTIRNGWAEYGGGVHVGQSSPTFSNCVFEFNTAVRSGGAIFAEDEARLFMVGCTFVENHALNTKGGAIAFWSSFATIVGSHFESNTSWSGGGAISTHSGRGLHVVDSVFRENHVRQPQWASMGGAIDAYTTNSTIVGSSFVGNSSQGHGGAIANINGSRSLIDDCEFRNNSSVGRAGALYINSESDTDISGCTFEGNSVRSDGDKYDGGGAIWAEIRCVVNIEDTDFIRNTSDEAGGAVVFGHKLDALVRNCRFEENESTHDGGALYVTPSALRFRVENGMFTRNISTNEGTGGAISTNAPDGVITNSTIVGNVPNAIYSAGGFTPQYTNCVVWDNGETPVFFDPSSIPVLTYCNVQHGFSGEGNIDIYPMFVRFGLDESVDPDLRLAPGSPCIDAGDNSSVPPELITDLDGNPRLVDDAGMPDIGNGTSPLVDIGAFEFQVSTGMVITTSHHPLPARSVVDVTIRNGRPNDEAYLAYSVSGIGRKRVPSLNVVLDLANPKLAAPPLVTDANGFGVWQLSIPDSGAGRPVWMQSAQFELTTNVLETAVQ